MDESISQAIPTSLSSRMTRSILNTLQSTESNSISTNINLTQTQRSPTSVLSDSISVNDENVDNTEKSPLCENCKDESQIVLIALLVGFGFLFVVLLIFVFILIRKKRKRQTKSLKQQSSSSNSNSNSNSNGNYDSIAKVGVNHYEDFKSARGNDQYVLGDLIEPDGTNN